MCKFQVQLNDQRNQSIDSNVCLRGITSKYGLKGRGIPCTRLTTSFVVTSTRASKYREKSERMTQNND